MDIYAAHQVALAAGMAGIIPPKPVPAKGQKAAARKLQVLAAGFRKELAAAGVSERQLAVKARLPLADVEALLRGDPAVSLHIVTAAAIALGIDPTKAAFPHFWAELGWLQ